MMLHICLNVFAGLSRNFTLAVAIVNVEQGLNDICIYFDAIYRNCMAVKN